MRTLPADKKQQPQPVSRAAAVEPPGNSRSRGAVPVLQNSGQQVVQRMSALSTYLMTAFLKLLPDPGYNTWFKKHDQGIQGTGSVEFMKGLDELIGHLTVLQPSLALRVMRQFAHFVGNDMELVQQFGGNTGLGISTVIHSRLIELEKSIPPEAREMASKEERPVAVAWQGPGEANAIYVVGEEHNAGYKKAEQAVCDKHHWKYTSEVNATIADPGLKEKLSQQPGHVTPAFPIESEIIKALGHALNIKATLKNDVWKNKYIPGKEHPLYKFYAEKLTGLVVRLLPFITHDQKDLLAKTNATFADPSNQEQALAHFDVGQRFVKYTDLALAVLAPLAQNEFNALSLGQQGAMHVSQIQQAMQAENLTGKNALEVVSPARSTIMLGMITAQAGSYHETAPWLVKIGVNHARDIKAMGIQLPGNVRFFETQQAFNGALPGFK